MTEQETEYNPFYYRTVLVASSGFGSEHHVNRRTDYCVTCDRFGGVHR